jgi:hypothetical protein
MKQPFTFSPEFKQGDLTHHGIDIYTRHQPELLRAMRSGRPFDTGFRGCKKEILSIRLSGDGDGGLTVEASVSDDFDTEGNGCVDTDMPTGSDDDILGALEELLGSAISAASDDKKSNEPYEGFSIHLGHDHGAWIETYLRPRPGEEHLDVPPGDNYHQWGFQEESGAIPRDVLDALKAWAEDDERDGETFESGGYVIKPWSDD